MGTKVSALTAATAITSDDLLYMVDDPTGTPVSRGITVKNARKNPSFYDASDTTKVIALDASGNTTAKTLTLKATNTTDQTLSFPNITGADTLQTLGLAQTITAVKTMSGLNVIEHANTGLTIRNPADTFDYTLTGGAITAARTITLPLTTQAETFAVVPQTASSNNANPAATTSTTGVMMGLAVAITPRVSGKLIVFVSGQGDQGTGDNGFKFDIRYGTGTAPTNGAALTGTQIGGVVTGQVVGSTSTTDVPTLPFSHQGIVSGLTVGTAYWIDISFGAVGGTTTATASKVNVSVIEL